MANISGLISRRTTLVEQVEAAEAFCTNFNEERDGFQLELRTTRLVETAKEYDHVQQKIIDLAVDSESEMEERRSHRSF